MLGGLIGKMTGADPEAMKFITAFLSGTPAQKQEVMATIAKGGLTKLKEVFQKVVEPQEGETYFHLLISENDGQTFISAVFIGDNNVLRLDKTYSIEQIIEMIPSDQMKMLG